MNAVTYDIRNAAAAVATAKPAPAAAPTAKKSIWARFWDAMIDARLHQADRIVRQHLYLVPQDVLRETGYLANYKDAEKLPFVK